MFTVPPRQLQTTHKTITISPMVIALALAVIGWLGWWYLTNNVHPNLSDGQPSLLARAAFLSSWLAALTGTAWPVLMALHRRFRGEPSPWTIWRQSTWVAAFGTACAWLQMNHWFNLALAAMVASVFMVIELILGMRARQETRQDDQTGRHKRRETHDHD